MRTPVPCILAMVPAMEYDEWLFKPKLWGEGIPLWKYWLALHDERVIESMDPCYDKVIALRTLDELQISGRLEIERARIRRVLDARKSKGDVKVSIAEVKTALKRQGDWDRQMGYLFLGLKSPDRDERERYRRARDWIQKHHGDALPHELAPIFGVIAKPKTVAGRKRKNVPSDADHSLLVMMKSLVARGSSVAAAARQVSEGLVKQHSREATQKRLEKWWRWKAKMRDFPLEFKSPLNLPSSQ